MYKVMIYKTFPNAFWLEDEKDFDTFWQALYYATKSGCTYEIYLDYWFISSVKLVARSSYDLWSRN